MSEAVTIELLGHVPAKKNNWRPRKGGGIFLDKETEQAIDRLAVQIPGYVRDLRLESPRIDFFFTYVRANWDRDNAATTLLDVLVEYGVLVDDNIKRCNGTITIHPAEQGEADSVRIVLLPPPREEASPRYVQPRRLRRRPPGIPGFHAPAVTLDDFEDLEGEDY